VGVGGGLGGNGPDGALVPGGAFPRNGRLLLVVRLRQRPQLAIRIPATAPCRRLGDRGRIVGVALALGEEVDDLVGTGGPVGHRRGLRVRLVPDDFVPQPPAVRLERQGELRRDHAEVLGLEAGWRAPPPRLVGAGREGPPFARELPARAVAARRVGVPEIDPCGPVGAEDTPDLLEDVYKVLHVFGGGRLEAELPAPAGAVLAERARVHVLDLGVRLDDRPATLHHRPAGAGGPSAVLLEAGPPGVRTGLVAAPHGRRQPVVPQGPVGRAGDHAVDRFVGQLGEQSPAVADVVARESEGAELHDDPDGEREPPPPEPAK
jgi:hypothetical protein